MHPSKEFLEEVASFPLTGFQLEMDKEDLEEIAEEDQERFGFKISWKGDRTRVYHFGTEFQVHILKNVPVSFLGSLTDKNASIVANFGWQNSWRKCPPSIKLLPKNMVLDSTNYTFGKCPSELEPWI